MARNQTDKTPASGGKQPRRKRGRAWLWVLLSVFLLLVLAGAGYMGLYSDSSYRTALQTLRAENRQQGELLRTLNAENAERDARADSLRADNADRDAQIRRLSADSADKDDQIQSLSADNADKDAQILDLSQRLAAAVLPEPAGGLPGAESPVEEPEPAESGPQPDAWGYVDEDGDGLILVPIRGKFTGYMLIVLDPSRVVLGCEPSYLFARGFEVDHFVEKADAVAGINGGGFADPGGFGDGSSPDTLIVHEGVVYCGGSGTGYGFAGIDDQYVLHVGIGSEEIRSLRIQEGCGYGPVLIKNGEIAQPEKLRSGLNPRTAIGQRSDGAILLLVTEGRQPSRIGCSYRDEAELLLSFGAVNACNMDGGSSTMMWYEGQYINNRCNVINTRPIPTSWVVLKEGRNGND